MIVNSVLLFTVILVIFSENRGRAAFWVSPRLKYCMFLNTRDIVAIRCTVSGEEVLRISCYCSPSEDIVPTLVELSGLIEKYPNYNVQVVGDFNTKSFIWGKRQMDPRGEVVISFAMAPNLEIINKPDSIATFGGHQGQSWIDFLLVRNCAHRIVDWTIQDWVTLSDHNAMSWTYQGRPADARTSDVHRRWRPRDLVWGEFLQGLRKADMDVCNHDSTDLGVEYFE